MVVPDLNVEEVIPPLGKHLAIIHIDVCRFTVV
jgi:hypothetical protein